MATNRYPRGSEWRKWDLHVHTPDTAKNDQFGSGEDKWEEYISKLESNEEISVLGITDYFSIDNYLLLKKKQEEGRLSDKTLIPNVELRILPVTRTDTPINIHVFFDPNLPIETINREFFQCLKFKYSGNEYSCLRQDLIALGRLYRNNDHLEEGCAKKEGIAQFNISYNELDEVLKKPSLRNYVVIAVSNSNRDGNSGIQHSSLAATRQEIYRMSDIIFSANDKDIQYFLGEGVDDEETIKQKYGSLKPCVIGSDAHSLDAVNVFPNNKTTWIKADPTFEGLKQILYEPESRVRIQEENPEYEIEKSPFTNITISEQTKVFSEEDDIFFDAMELPLNNNLVSIIGGRGTGKSQLINYLAAAFNRNVHIGKYNLESSVKIARKTSLLEEEKVFDVSTEPNAPFIYIAQSQIKELVEKKERFSKNILETIGVNDTYKQDAEYVKLVDEMVNEYYRIIKVLYGDGKNTQEQKNEITKEIKRYEDFIQSITSEQNKKKLETYKIRVDELNKIISRQTKIAQQYEKNEAFVEETNQTIKVWNEKLKELGVSVPLIDIQPTQKYIKEVLLPKLQVRQKEIESAIQTTRNEFKDYKGDLSALLSNVSSYQNKLSELQKEKEQIEAEEKRYKIIATETFKKLGDKIVVSIDNYKTLIDEKWNDFKGVSSLNPSKKELLDIILKDDLKVEAEVIFDKDKLYSLLIDRLDGRSYSIEKLQNIIGINTMDDYFDFICQKREVHTFSEGKIREDLRRQLLYVLFKRFTDFISVGVKVLLNGKPITKLSYGQQGTIYLRLQLAANLYSETIIYDQPEDDLDNEFISDELISIFKTLKKYRQIIIVSHNANLVVNSDSEQVIVAKNTDGILSYSSGSLEDPFINSEVCRVLEGGKKAFEERERKYRLS